MKYLKYIFIFCFITILSLSAQTPEQLKSWLPQINGWEIADQVEVFDEENLFDRINGAAPLFIENNFQEMTSMEYVKGDDYITIQAYRHGTPEDAFGMYASERSPELKQFPIGGEAQGDNESMYFFAGNIYIKMWSRSSTDVSETIHAIAKGLADKIDGDASYPAIFKAFPSENKLPYTEAYITSSYIGHEFLKSVYLAKYNIDGKALQLFVVDGHNEESAKDILTKYFTFTKQSDEIRQGELLIKDRYNGEIPAIWKGQYIIGVFSEDGENIEKNRMLLTNLADNLLDL